MTVNLRQIEPPTAEPVSLEEARQQLHEDFCPEDEFDQDQVLPIYIQAAREYAEAVTSLLLTDALYELRIDGLCGTVYLPVARVGSVSLVEYVDVNGDEQELSTSVYKFDDNPDKPALRLRYGKSWPNVLNEANSVRIQFRSLYSVSDSPPVPIPASVKQAILLLIGHYYENREEVVIGKAASSVPAAATSLLWINRTSLGV